MKYLNHYEKFLVDINYLRSIKLHAFLKAALFSTQFRFYIDVQSHADKMHGLCRLPSGVKKIFSFL